MTSTTTMNATSKKPELEYLNRFARARAGARRLAPYFSSALYALVPNVVPGFNTFATTERGVVLLGTEALDRWNDEEMVGVVLHEVMHIIQRTFARCGGRDHQLWNMAVDIPDNEMVLELGARLPAGHLTAEMFGLQKGMTSEAIYDALLQQQNAAGGGEGSGQGGPKDKAGNSPGQGQCGSCAAGGGTKQEETADATDGRSQSEMERVARQVARDVKAHAQKAAAGRGNVPGRLVEWAEASTAPVKVPWHEKLMCIVQDAHSRIVAGATDYSMTRPSWSSRVLDPTVLRPSMVAYAPEPAILLDTSGSMGADELSLSLREASAALAAAGDEAWFIEIDTEVACPPRRIKSEELGKVDIHGRGGTDLRPAFAAMERLNPRPNLVLIFTDGDTPMVDKAPDGVEVVWVLVGGHARRAVEWGHEVVVER